MRLKAKKTKQKWREKRSQNRKRKERKQTEAKTDFFSRADHFVNRGALDSILYPIDGIIIIVMAVDKRK